MPVFVFVAQVLLLKNQINIKIANNIGTYLGINSNDCVALLTSVCENSFIAFDAIRMLISQDIALTSQAFVTVPTAEVTRMPVLRHGFCVFATEN